MRRSLLTILVVALVVFSPASEASGGTTTPLCPNGSSPDCVLSNWGQTGPDGVDTGLLPLRGDPLASADGSSQRPLKLMAVVNMTKHQQVPDSPLKTVVSPINLFPKETAALTSAIKRARFNPDGSIATGQERIASAAAAAARAAGTRYTLTLYIKVPQRLGPDASGSLDRKVQSINDVLAPPASNGQTGTPKS